LSIPIAATDVEWMRLALEEARLCQKDVPIGAIIVAAAENRELARAYNRKEESKDPTDHAEIICIRRAAQLKGDWRLDDMVIYTTLEPCPMCAEAIIQARIAKLVFGAYDSRSGAAGSVFNLFLPKRQYPNPEVIGGILEEECQSLLKDFFRKKAD
jgi:tRNA(adenine34) deaminase